MSCYTDDAFCGCRRCCAAREPTFVYFLQEADGGPIKIGYGWRPADRLRGAQVGNPRPLRLLGSISGGRALERAWHLRFQTDRIRGEWFAASPDLVDAIEGALRGPGKATP